MEGILLFYLLIFCQIWNPKYSGIGIDGARYQTVGHKNTVQRIQLKSQYDILPNTFQTLHIDVQQDNLQINGLSPPKLKRIYSNDLDGIYGVGDVVQINLEFTAEVNVSGIPTLTLNTGCHDSSCYIPEIQSFFCAAELGSFALKLDSHYVMTIDSNLTQDQFKYKLESIRGVEEVTIKYSQFDHENTMLNRVCTSTGNTIEITFEDISFSTYDGDIPELEFDQFNWYPNERTMLSQGNVKERLHGRLNEYQVKLSTIATEVQKGHKQSDNTALYRAGSGTKTLMFQYTVRSGDYVDNLHVVSLNDESGYIYSAITGQNISTAVPKMNSAYRYLDSSPSSLSHNNQLAITSQNPQVVQVTSPNPDGIYTQGDVITIYVKFSLPIKFYGNNIYITLRPGPIYRYAYVNKLLSDSKTLVFEYMVAAGDRSSDLTYLDVNSLVLGDSTSRIFKNSVSNTSIASLVLPAIGSSNSLSYLKDIIIDTDSPVIINFESASSSGNYTAGDSLLLLLEYNFPIHVIGQPIIWVKNTPKILGNSTILTAPLGQVVSYDRSTASDISAINVVFQLNWLLSTGDLIDISIPFFHGYSETDIFIDPRTTYAPQFMTSWNSSTSILSLELVSGNVAPTEVIEIIIQSRSGLGVPSAGLFNEAPVTFSITSSPPNSSQFRLQDITFNYLRSVSYTTASLQILPMQPNEAATSMYFYFEVPNPLKLQDKIIFNLPDFVLKSGSSSSSTSNPIFTIKWIEINRTLELEVKLATDALSYSINIATYIQLMIPQNGVNADSITFSANMLENGVVKSAKLPYLTHICANPESMVIYHSDLPGSASGLTFAWTVGYDPLETGDSVVYTLPSWTNSALHFDVSKFLTGDVDGWMAEASLNVITFTRSFPLSPKTRVTLHLSSESGFFVPVTGIRRNIDSFSVQIISQNCGMSSPLTTNFTNFVIPIYSPEFIPTSVIVNPTQSIGFQLRFRILEDLLIGDYIYLNLPDFTREEAVSHYDTVASSTVTLSPRYNSAKRRFEFQLLQNYNYDGTFFQITIPSSPGIYLPSNGLSHHDTNAITMGILSFNGQSDNIPVLKSCIGFCHVNATYSTQISHESLTIIYSIQFSQTLSSSDQIVFEFSDIVKYSNLLLRSQLTFGSTFSWVDISSSLTLPIGTTIPAFSTFLVTVEGIQLLTQDASVTLKISGSLAKPSGFLSWTDSIPDIVLNPILMDTNIILSSNYSRLVTNMTISFTVVNFFVIDYSLGINLPGFNLDDAYMMSSPFFSYQLKSSTQFLLHPSTNISSGSTIQLQFANVVLPSDGIDPNSHSITYFIKYSSEVISPSHLFTNVSDIRLIRSPLVDIELSGYDVMSITVSFWTNVNLTTGDTIKLSLNGLYSDLSTCMVSSTLNAMGIFISPTITFTMLSNHFFGPYSFTISNSPTCPMYLPTSGYQSDNHDGTIHISQLSYAPPIHTNSFVSLSCIGICRAFITPDTPKAGFTSRYVMYLDLSTELLTGDQFIFHLPGFSKSNESTFVLINTDSILITGSWAAINSELSINIALLNHSAVSFGSYAGGIYSYELTIPRSQYLKLPPQGILSGTKYFMIWNSGHLGHLEGGLLSIKPVSTLTSVELFLFPLLPDHEVNASLIVQISNPLSADDEIEIALPSFHVLTEDIAIFGSYKGDFTLRGTEQDPVAKISYLSFICETPIPADTRIVLEFSNIKTPYQGVNSLSPPATLAIKSMKDASLASQQIMTYTKIGSLQNTVLRIYHDRDIQLIGLQLVFDIYCPPASGDVLLVKVPALDAETHFLNTSSSKVTATWLSGTSTLEIAFLQDADVGFFNLTLTSFTIRYSSAIYYPDDGKFEYQLVSTSCPIYPSKFQTVFPIGLTSSSLSFSNLYPGQVSSLQLTIETAALNLLPGDIIYLRLEGFTIPSTQSTELVTRGNGMDYFTGVFQSYYAINDYLQITLLVSNEIPPSTTISIDFGSENNISLPLMGILPNSESVSIIISLDDLHLNTFSGKIQNIQSFGKFLNNSITFGNPRSGITTDMTIDFSLTGELNPSDQVIYSLPNFLLLYSPPPVFQNSSYVTGIWDDIQKQLILTVVVPIERQTKVMLYIPRGIFVTPSVGISVLTLESYSVSVLSNSSPVPPTLFSIDLIPSVTQSLISFTASDIWDTSVLADTNGTRQNVILLYPGHSINSDDIGDTITISNVQYTIKNISVDTLELEEAYIGPVISLGVPSTHIYTPDARPAVYHHGSDSTKLFFQYQIRKDDFSRGIDIHSTTSSPFVSHPLTLNANDRMFRLSKNPSLSINTSLSSFSKGEGIFVDSFQPTVIRVTTTSPEGTYTAGTAFDVHVTFSLPVSVRPNLHSSPALLLRKFPDALAVARYHSGSGTSTLVFSYIIQNEDILINSQQLLTIANNQERFFQPLRVIMNDRFNYIRRQAISPLIDVSYSIADDVVEVPQNIFWIANGTSVVSISTHAQHPYPDNTYSAGDNILIEVSYSNPVNIQVNDTSIPLHSQVFIELNVGKPSGFPGKAFLTNSSDPSKLLFLYTIQIEDNLEDGLSLFCTCEDYYQRTTIQTTNDVKLTNSLPPYEPIQVILAHDSLPSSLLLNPDIRIDNTPPTIRKILSNVTAGVYSPGKIILLSIYWSHNVSVIGQTRLQLSGFLTDCIANYYSGNNTNKLNYLYQVSSNSATSALSCRYIFALEALSGNIYKTSQVPTVIVDPTVPIPGDITSVGVQSKLTLDSSDIGAKSITIRHDESVQSLVYYPFTMFDFHPESDTIVHLVFRYEHEKEQIDLIYNSSFADYRTSFNMLLNDPFQLIHLFGQHGKQSYLVKNSANSPYLYSPITTTTQIDSPFHYDSPYWWSKYQTSRVVDLSLSFDRPVVGSGAYFPLNSGKTLNHAILSFSSRQWKLIIDVRNLGSIQNQYQIRYGGYKTACIPVSSSSSGVMSLHAKLTSIPALLQLGVLVRRIQDDGNYKIFELTSIKSANYELQIATSFAECANPLDYSRITLKGDSLPFRYSIRDKNSVILSPRGLVSRGNYTLVVQKSNGIRLNSYGILRDSFIMEHISSIGHQISQRVIPNVAMPRVSKSHLIFDSNACPGCSTFVRVFLCVDINLEVGDVIFVKLPMFETINGGNLLFADDTYQIEYFISSETLAIGFLTSVHGECIDIFVNSSFGLLMPTVGNINTNRFQYTLQGGNGILSNMLFNTVSKFLISELSLRVLNPIPNQFSNISISFSLNFRLPINTTLFVDLPQYRLARSQWLDFKNNSMYHIAPLSLIGPYSHAFNATWLNSSVIQLITKYIIEPNIISIHVTQDSKIIVPALSLPPSTNPPVISLYSQNWTLDTTIFEDFTEVIGLTYSSLTLHTQFEDRVLEELSVTMTLSYPLDGPVEIIIEAFPLTHSRRFSFLQVDENVSISWNESVKQLKYVTREAISNVTDFVFLLPVVFLQDMSLHRFGIPANVETNGLKLSIKSPRATLPLTSFTSATCLPTIIASHLSYSQDSFSSDASIIDLTVFLNTPINEGDVFDLLIPGAQNTSIVNYFVSINDTTYNIRYLAENETLRFHVRNCSRANITEINWIIPQKVGLHRPNSLVQYDINPYRLSWKSSLHSATSGGYVDVYPTTPFLSSSITCHSPFANSQSDMTIRLILTERLIQNDILVFYLDNFSFPFVAETVLDNYENLWIAKWDGVFQTLKLQATISLPPIGLVFTLNDHLAPTLPSYNPALRLSMQRNTKILIPQQVATVSRIGDLLPASSIMVTSRRRPHFDVLNISFKLYFLSPLSVGDKIDILLDHIKFDFDEELMIHNYDIQSTTASTLPPVSAKIDSDNKLIRLTILEAGHDQLSGTLTSMKHALHLDTSRCAPSSCHAVLRSDSRVCPFNNKTVNTTYLTNFKEISLSLLPKGSKQVILALNFSSNVPFSSKVSLTIPQLLLTDTNYAASLSYSSQSFFELYQSISISWNDTSKWLSISFLGTIPSGDYQVVVPLENFTLSSGIIYENDPMILYCVEFGSWKIDNIEIDHIVPNVLKTSALIVDHVPMGAETSLSLQVTPTVDFDATSVINITLPTFYFLQAFNTLTFSSTCSLGRVIWINETSLISITFSHSCSTLDITFGVNNSFRFTEILSSNPPQLLISRGIDIQGPERFLIYPCLSSISSSSLLFQGTVVSSQPTEAVLNFNTSLALQTSDSIQATLPQFWSTDTVIAFECESDGLHLDFLAEWFECSETLQLVVIRPTPSISHCIRIIGLRLPRFGISQSLATFMKLSGEISGGVIVPSPFTRVQLVGNVLTSSLSFTNLTSLLTETGFEISLQFESEIALNDEISIHLPGFTFSSPLRVYDGVNLTLESLQLSADYVNETIILTALTPISGREQLSFIVGGTSAFNGGIRPSKGISYSDITGYTISTNALQGPIVSQPFEIVEAIGFESYSLEYHIVDMQQPVQVHIYIQFSHVLSPGDNITIFAPSVSAPSCSDLHLQSGSASNYFESSVRGSFDRSTNTIFLTLIHEVPAHVEVDIFITPENNFTIGENGTKDRIHFISAMTNSVGELQERILPHSPSNIIPITVTHQTLSCENDLSGVQECAYAINFTLSSDIDDSSTLVFSHENWLRHSISDVLELDGPIAAVFNATWRSSDDVTSLSASSTEILLESGGFLRADEDYDIFQVPLDLPPFMETVEIRTTIPRVLTLRVEWSYERIICGDSVLIDLVFSEPVLIIPSSNQFTVKLQLNTEESALFYSGNNTSILSFIYHVRQPSSVLNLSVRGPNSVKLTNALIYRSGSLSIVANVTIPTPYGEVLWNTELFAHQLEVNCESYPAKVRNIELCNRPYQTAPLYLHSGDILDICIEFERPVEILDDTSVTLRLKGESITSSGNSTLVATYVNVSSEQWILLDDQFGSFSLVYGQVVTSCIDWYNMSSLYNEILSIKELADSFPLVITPYSTRHGHKYQLEFSGVPPFPLQIAPHQCPYESTARVQLPRASLQTIVLRREILSSDIFESNHISIYDSDSLTTEGGDIFVVTNLPRVVRANTTLPFFETDLFLIPSPPIRTQPPVIVSIHSNFSRIGEAGDEITIIVQFSNPISVIGDPILEICVNNSLNVIHKVNLTLDSYYQKNRSNQSLEILFKYIVSYGDVATPLNDSRLYANGGSVWLSALHPTTPAILDFPLNSTHRLISSEIVVNATDVSTLSKIYTNLFPGEYGAGEEMIIYLEFLSPVFLYGGNPQILLNTTTSGRPMNYTSGNGTSILSFFYLIEVGDETLALSTMSSHLPLNYCIELLGSILQDRFHHRWSKIDCARTESLLHLISIDTSEPVVWRVNSATDNGRYYPGDEIDVTVLFSKPVVIIPFGNMLPAIELFIPHQKDYMLAPYASGNGTTEIHFSYLVPQPPYRIAIHPKMFLDYVHSSALYDHLRDSLFFRASSHPTTPANVFLPPADVSFLHTTRTILVIFENPKITSIRSLNQSGTYTSGDILFFEIAFSSPVMTINPPVLRLDTGKIHRNAFYHSGNQTNKFSYFYEVQSGDYSPRLDYVDTRLPPYSADFQFSFALSTDIRIGSTGRLKSGSAGRENDIIFKHADTWGAIYSYTTHSRVPSLINMVLPLPGEAGSLSANSDIRIDTTRPNVTRIYTTIPDGSYGSGVEIPIFVKFNQLVVYQGFPVIQFDISQHDRYAYLLQGNHTSDLKFVYVVTSFDDMPLFDYRDRNSLYFPASLNSDVKFIKRDSQNPSIDANLTLAWVTYVESVISSRSISGSGHRIRLAGIANAVPTKISLHVETASKTTIGDILEITIVFSNPVQFLNTNSYIELNIKSKAYYLKHINDTAVLFLLCLQSHDEATHVTYPTIYSLRTSDSSSIRDLTTGKYAAQNLPWPRSTDSDMLSNKNTSVSQVAPTITSFSLIRPSIIHKPEKPLSTLCNSSGYDWAYSEVLNSNTYVRIITRSRCPNHFSSCQLKDCTDDESNAIPTRNDQILVPLYPTLTSSNPITTACTVGAIGVALNGVDIYGPTDNSTDCADATSLLGHTFDKCGGHINEISGIYHYHVAPVCLLTQLGSNSKKHSPQVGWAIDGFPIYGSYGINGVLMAPCSSSIANSSYCLDECNGYYGELPGIDDYLYRYYLLGEGSNEGCSQWVSNSGRCSKGSDPCCMNRVPDFSSLPSTVSCLKGCLLGDASCISASKSGYTGSYLPQRSHHPTAVYDNTVETLQSTLDRNQAFLESSKADYSPYYPNQDIYDIVWTNSVTSDPIRTGEQIFILITFSDAVVVIGSPSLTLYASLNSISLPYSGLFNESTLKFSFVVTKEFVDVQFDCTSDSSINLNGGRIIQAANFMPIREVDLTLSRVCCRDQCDKSFKTVSTVPSVVAVYASLNGTFSSPDELTIFIEFSGPIIVVGTPALELHLFRVPNASYVGLVNSTKLEFTYTIVDGDSTASLDYVSPDSLLFLNKGPYDGIFMANVFAKIEANYSLPKPGKVGSLGRSNTIIIDKTRPMNIAVDVSLPLCTAGDILIFSYVYNRDVVVINNYLNSLFVHEPVNMTLEFVIIDSDQGRTVRTAVYDSFNGNTVSFKYQVTPIDPSGIIQIAARAPINLGDYSIKDKVALVNSGLVMSLSYQNVELSVIDNTPPFVVQVTSPNITTQYPWGLGDVIYFTVQMNLPVVLFTSPTLRLRFDTTVAYATITTPVGAISDYYHMTCYTNLVFQYAIESGDIAYPLEYDGIYALEGDVRKCVNDAIPSIPANLVLPPPFTRGSVGFCCPINVDSSPPFVQYMMPLKKSGVYGMNELIVILVRFSKPVYVIGQPLLALDVGHIDGTPGYAFYNSTPFEERDVLIDIFNTDLLFYYYVGRDDLIEDLHHYNAHALILNSSIDQILHFTQSPTTPADLRLREPDDNDLVSDKVTRQWKFHYPARVELVIRDFYHTDPSQLTVQIEHSSRSLDLFSSCCNEGTFGRSLVGSRLGTNATVFDSDTGIGTDFVFADNLGENIALRGVANQSTTIFGGTPNRAIDGTMSPLFGDKSSTATSLSDVDAWWQVHLPFGSNVQSINIWPTTPQTWIPAVVAVTVKAYDSFPRGRFKLLFKDVDISTSATDPGVQPSIQSLTTQFISMGASESEIQSKIKGITSLAQLHVHRETIYGDDVEKGHGWKYLITFHGLEIAEPIVEIINSTFIGSTDNLLSFQMALTTEVVKKGYAKSVTQVAQFVGGEGGQNSWLVPYWLMLFEENGNQPPLSLNESLATAVYSQRFETIYKLEQIVLNRVYQNIGYVKIQRIGEGSLGLAEVEVYSVRLNSLKWYRQGYPVHSSNVVEPYQSVDSFRNSFNNVPYYGRWSLLLTSSPNHTTTSQTTIQGYDGSYGTISDWILVVTDLAGVVKTYYQDLRAEILSLPKYGTLLTSTDYTTNGYGEWKEIFQLQSDHEIQSSDERQRYLGICYGVDTTGMNGIRSGVHGYRYCHDSYGVGHVMNNWRDGNYPNPSQFIRNERMLFYIPRLDYLGPDYFTYRIFNGPVIQSSGKYLANQVTIHVRDCRDNQDNRSTLHPLCSCESDQLYVIANYSLCRQEILTICEDSLTANIFPNLCQICYHSMLNETYPSSLISSPLLPYSAISSTCISEIIRAVSFVTESRLCDKEPLYKCRDEAFTMAGRESFNYLSLETRTLNFPFSLGREYTGSRFADIYQP